MIRKLTIIAAGLAIAGSACAQTPPPTAARQPSNLNAYLASLQDVGGEGNMGGQPSSQAGMSYRFTCLQRRYDFAVTAHYVGEKRDHHVQLDRIGGDWGPLSAGDRQAVQAELDHFTNIATVSLRCASDGTYAYLVSGYGRADGPPSPERLRLFWFDHGRLLRIQE